VQHEDADVYRLHAAERLPEGDIGVAANLLPDFSGPGLIQAHRTVSGMRRMFASADHASSRTFRDRLGEKGQALEEEGHSVIHHTFRLERRTELGRPGVLIGGVASTRRWFIPEPAQPVVFFNHFAPFFFRDEPRIFDTAQDKYQTLSLAQWRDWLDYADAITLTGRIGGSFHIDALTLSDRQLARLARILQAGRPSRAALARDLDKLSPAQNATVIAALFGFAAESRTAQSDLPAGYAGTSPGDYETYSANVRNAILSPDGMLRCHADPLAAFGAGCMELKPLDDFQNWLAATDEAARMPAQAPRSAADPLRAASRAFAPPASQSPRPAATRQTGPAQRHSQQRVKREPPAPEPGFRR
jgi:hypothetical protein